MSATSSSPGPNNMMLLIVLGIGAYYLMSRRAVAQPIYQTRPGATGGSSANIIGQGLGALAGLFGRGSSGSTGGTNYMGTVDGRSASQWDVTPQGSDGPRYNNPSAYVGGDDSVPVNPPFNSVYDWHNEYWA